MFVARMGKEKEREKEKEKSALSFLSFSLSRHLFLSRSILYCTRVIGRIFLIDQMKTKEEKEKIFLSKKNIVSPTMMQQKQHNEQARRLFAEREEKEKEKEKGAFAFDE